MSPPLLTRGELEAALKGLPEWRVEEGVLRRDVQCVSFPSAIELVTRIAEVAEEMNHHPDIDIRWRTLHLSVVTHASGGLTRYDAELATRIDALAAD
ncbi:MAG: 4a-hydroxytetrahydrobiopterin dehydratase [Streptosporangiales bacterium]|nr:4a-hydroxytetrahydrobiopterin dehydratase [Streptosporangiales bacterium]